MSGETLLTYSNMETKAQTLIEKLFELKKKSIVIFRDEQAFNYKYADLAQIQETIAPFLEELWLLIIHKTIGGKVCTFIVNIDNADDSIFSEIDIGKINTTREWTDKNNVHVTEVTEQDPQAVGSIITYYRRYNLLQLLDLKTEDNDWASASPRAKNAPIRDDVPQTHKVYPKSRWDEILEEITVCEDLWQLKTYHEELMKLAKSDKQKAFYNGQVTKEKKRIQSNDIHEVFGATSFEDTIKD